MVMAGRGRGSSCDMHESPIAHTHHECTAETSIGGVGTIHRMYRIVMGVARYIRHPTEPSIPRILSVPLGRESTGAIASRPQRKEPKHEQRQNTDRYHDRIRKIPRRWHTKTYDGSESTQNVSTTTKLTRPWQEQGRMRPKPAAPASTGTFTTAGTSRKSASTTQRGYNTGLKKPRVDT